MDSALKFLRAHRGLQQIEKLQSLVEKDVEEEVVSFMWYVMTGNNPRIPLKMGKPTVLSCNGEGHPGSKLGFPFSCKGSSIPVPILEYLSWDL